ncbi:MAG: nucleoside triphosphate pyrophosphohydrolase [Pseudomonadota bacterium]
MQQLLAVMARLRDPEHGCPWDLEQDFSTIAPYTIEEAYEVADAIERHAYDELEGELGDLLLQVVFHAQMARESGLFDFDDVARSIAQKMIRRHPHVFADADADTPDAVKSSWEATKAAERGDNASALAGVARALPALMRAQKLGSRAARTGFDWPAADAVVEKIHEELGEVAERPAHDADGLEEEVGDLLFCVVNYARHLGVDAETALRRANAKFERRFTVVEAALPAAAAMPLDERRAAMERAWDDAKARERGD